MGLAETREPRLQDVLDGQQNDTSEREVPVSAAIGPKEDNADQYYGDFQLYIMLETPFDLLGLSSKYFGALFIWTSLLWQGSVTWTINVVFKWHESLQGNSTVIILTRLWQTNPHEP